MSVVGVHSGHSQRRLHVRKVPNSEVTSVPTTRKQLAGVETFKSATEAGRKGVIPLLTDIVGEYPKLTKLSFRNLPPLPVYFLVELRFHDQSGRCLGSSYEC